MSEVQAHFQLLGLKVKDRVTGFSGVVSSLSFDLYGCIQAIIHPGLQVDGKMGDQCWFDINRLEILSAEPVMNRPNSVKWRKAIRAPLKSQLSARSNR